MVQSKLWQLFQKLSLKDLRVLKKCVQSPWFNTRNYVQVLFEVLAESKKQGSNVPSKEEVYSILFPNQSYDDHLMRNAMSLLMQVMEKSLGLEEVLQDAVEIDLSLARVYRRLNYEKQYFKTIKKISAKLEGESQRNADYFNQTYQLEAEKYQWLSTVSRMGDLNLQEISDNLDLSYMAQKLRQTCFSISHQTVFQTKYDFGLLENILEVLATGKYLNIPTISIYYYCYLALTEEVTTDAFAKFKEGLLSNASLFPQRELRDLYLLATNYCIKKMNAGERQFAKEGLDIYKQALKQKVLLVNGELSRFTYFNIITKALVCEELDWAEQFILKNEELLAKQYRESATSFSMARVYYQRSEHAKALNLLQKADYDDLLQNLQAKALLSKIYFELDEIEVLLSHLDAMQQFIRRKKVIAYHRDLFLNFIQILRRILELPNSERRNNASIRNQIMATSAIADKKWLLSLVK